jgi:hypothetical protein
MRTKASDSGRRRNRPIPSALPEGELGVVVRCGAVRCGAMRCEAVRCSRHAGGSMRSLYITEIKNSSIDFESCKFIRGTPNSFAFAFISNSNHYTSHGDNFIRIIRLISMIDISTMMVVPLPGLRLDVEAISGILG